MRLNSAIPQRLFGTAALVALGTGTTDLVEVSTGYSHSELEAHQPCRDRMGETWPEQRQQGGTATRRGGLRLVSMSDSKME